MKVIVNTTKSAVGALLASKLDEANRALANVEVELAKLSEKERLIHNPYADMDESRKKSEKLACEQEKNELSERLALLEAGENSVIVEFDL